MARQTQPVLWPKGLVLTPQHLQTHDRYLEDLVVFNLGVLSPVAWGFRRLELDHEQLEGGVVALRAASGIFPDGLAFDGPDADALPPPRPLAPVWGADQTSCTIYLAVPHHRERGVNVSVAGRGLDTRYLAETVLQRDETTGLAERPLQVGRKNLRLLTGNESPEGASTLPVAVVEREPGGRFRYVQAHVPPLLDLAASPALQVLVRSLIERMTAKAAALAATRRQRNKSLADFSVADVANFWLLYTLNSHLPRLRHLADVRHGHPAHLFAALLELAGSLTTFSSSIAPQDLPTYDHAEPGPGWQALDAALKELLETVVPANCVSLPLGPVRPAIVKTDLDDPRYLQATQVYLAVSAGLKKAELIARVPQLLKIAELDSLERLVRLALPGLGLTYVAEPPSAVPVKVDHEYFRVDRTSAEWETVLRARNLAAYVPADIPDARLELVLVLPAER